MKFRIAKAAVRDLDEIFIYWAKVAGVDVADRLLDSIERRFEVLGAHPHMGHKCDEFAPGVLCFPAGKYLIFYQLKRGRVHILHIVHGARDRSPREKRP